MESGCDTRSDYRSKAKIGTFDALCEEEWLDVISMKNAGKPAFAFDKS
jgi:hypothetical protein